MCTHKLFAGQSGHHSRMMLIFVPKSTDTCTKRKISLSTTMKDLDVTKLTAHKLTWTCIHHES